MDAENLALQLQQQIQDATQSRLQAIEARQLTQAETLARIEENTKSLPALVTRVDELEKTDSRHRGVLWALGAMWAALVALIEVVRR